MRRARTATDRIGPSTSRPAWFSADLGRCSVPKDEALAVKCSSRSLTSRAASYPSCTTSAPTSTERTPPPVSLSRGSHPTAQLGQTIALHLTRLPEGEPAKEPRRPKLDVLGDRRATAGGGQRDGRGKMNPARADHGADKRPVRLPGHGHLDRVVPVQRPQPEPLHRHVRDPGPARAPTRVVWRRSPRRSMPPRPS